LTFSKKVIAEEDGALVKTIGDAVMAVFRQPVSGIEGECSARRKCWRCRRGGCGSANFESRNS